MSEMVEKVAKAIVGSRCKDVDELWKAWSQSTKDLYLNEARSAIEAMRDTVKCHPDGNRDDHIKFNRYIDFILRN